MDKGLSRLSLEDEELRNGSRKSALVVSQYQSQFQPLAMGLRASLWADGFHQRVQRKSGGWKHFKLEWLMSITDRRKDEDDDGRQAAGDGGLCEATQLEHLRLPPSKLEKKRLALLKMYEARAKRQVEEEAAKLDPHKSQGNAEDTTTDRSRRNPLKRIKKEYEKNKQNNLQSHIVMPSCRTSLRSLRSPSTKKTPSKQRHRSASPTKSQPPMVSSAKVDSPRKKPVERAKHKPSEEKQTQTSSYQPKSEEPTKND